MKLRTVIEQLNMLFRMGSELEEVVDDKQDKLIAGGNIILNGNVISAYDGGDPGMSIDTELDTNSINPVQNKAIATAVEGKQDTLVSGETIKTINNETILSSGNIDVQEPLVSGTNIKTINNESILDSGNINLQETLVSGTNIKTINGSSILGSGNIDIDTTTVYKNPILHAGINNVSDILTKQVMSEYLTDSGFTKSDFNNSDIMLMSAYITDSASITKLQTLFDVTGIISVTIVGTVNHGTHYTGSTNEHYMVNCSTQLMARIISSSYIAPKPVDVAFVGWGIYSSGIIPSGYGIDTDQVEDCVIGYDSTSGKGYIKLKELELIQPVAVRKTL